jgi:uncharacterized repeat protein (TIGR03843 family)
VARRRRRWWAPDEDLEDEIALLGGNAPDELIASVALKAAAPPFDSVVEQVLADGEVVGVRPIPWGSNYSFIAVMARGSAPEVLAVYKPRRGEVPLWDFPDGTLYQREYAAYRVSRALGLEFIPPTVIREGPHGVGTFQLFVEPDDSIEYYQFRGEHVDELRSIALFDVITNNADRKAGHCFKGRDGRIWGIDHGLTFNVVPKLRTVIWDFCGQPLPEMLAERLMDFCTDPGRSAALRDELDGILHPHEVEAFFTRLERIAERGEFPALDPYRNVPRGFF